jgi:hypothetical protein
VENMTTKQVEEKTRPIEEATLVERKETHIENATVVLVTESDGNIHIHIHQGKIEAGETFKRLDHSLYFRLGEPRFSVLDCKFYKFGYINEETRKILKVE